MNHTESAHPWRLSVPSRSETPVIEPASSGGPETEAVSPIIRDTCDPSFLAEEDPFVRVLRARGSSFRTIRAPYWKVGAVPRNRHAGEIQEVPLPSGVSFQAGKLFPACAIAYRYHGTNDRRRGGNRQNGRVREVFQLPEDPGGSHGLGQHHSGAGNLRITFESRSKNWDDAIPDVDFSRGIKSGVYALVDYGNARRHTYSMARTGISTCSKAAK